MVSRYFEGEDNIFPARTMDAYKASFVSEWLSVVSVTHWPLFFFLPGTNPLLSAY
jgi:hypothetical protein